VTQCLDIATTNLLPPIPDSRVSRSLRTSASQPFGPFPSGSCRVNAAALAIEQPSYSPSENGSSVPPSGPLTLRPSASPLIGIQNRSRSPFSNNFAPLHHLPPYPLWAAVASLPLTWITHPALKLNSGPLSWSMTSWSGLHDPVLRRHASLIFNGRYAIHIHHPLMTGIDSGMNPTSLLPPSPSAAYSNSYDGFPLSDNQYTLNDSGFNPKVARTVPAKVSTHNSVAAAMAPFRL
jgi:hypothetical protein